MVGGVLSWFGRRFESVSAREFRRLRWQNGEVERRPVEDAGKVRIAAGLGEETTVTLKWIAQRLQMGTWTNLNHHLYWAKRNQA